MMRDIETAAVLIAYGVVGGAALLLMDAWARGVL